MATRRWKAFPHPAKEYDYAPDALKKHWARLHRGDCEPFPRSAAVREAWRHFHAGRFGEAVAAGIAAGGDGITAANKAQAIHANGVESAEAARIAHFQEVMARAEAQVRASPKNPNAHYLFAYAAGRYSQRISVAKALAEGYGGRIRAALALQPKHAEAQIALGAWHAEIIDKVGALVAGLTYGAKKDAAERHFQEALRLAPESPIARIEMARGIVMIHGRKAAAQAARLLAEAAAIEPRDAMEKLDVEAARAQGS
jgi:tetratricopeptide (TPR) repeat protein